MAEAKKTKTVKKITEIPNASVTIEVEENAEEAKVKTEAVETEKPEEVVENTDDSDSSGGFSWKKVFLIVLVVVPVGLLIFGGILYFSKNFSTDFLKKESTKKIDLPQESPTPTVEEADKQAYAIEVQNGSGIAGEGARVAEILDDAGFKTGAIGNADNSNYTDTIITVSDEVSDAFIEKLTQVLEERGSVGKVEKFATGEDGEVLVIVGSDVKEEDDEEKTSPTPTP